MTLTNTTIAFNESGTAGAGVLADSSATVAVHNSIVFGNFLRGASNKGASINPQLEVRAGSDAAITARFSLVEGGFAGDGNQALDPQFIEPADPGDGTWETEGDNNFGNLRLLETSPAIDAGDNTAAVDITGATLQTAADLPFDADRQRRRLKIPTVPDTGIGGPPVVDTGAFEFGDGSFEDGFKDGFENPAVPADR